MPTSNLLRQVQKSLYTRRWEALGRATLGLTSNGGFAAARVCGSDVPDQRREGARRPRAQSRSRWNATLGRQGVVSNGPDYGKPPPLKRP